MRLAICLLAAALAACTTTYEFEPLDVGDEGGGRDPAPRSSAQFVAAIYADLLGRTPTRYDVTITQGAVELLRFPLDEEDLLVAALDAAGDPAPVRDLIVAGLVRSPEAAVPAKGAIADPGAFVDDQFRRLLGRLPSAYERAAFVDAWARDPAVGPRAVIRAIVGSREYQSR